MIRFNQVPTFFGCLIEEMIPVVAVPVAPVGVVRVAVPVVRVAALVEPVLGL